MHGRHASIADISRVLNKARPHKLRQREPSSVKWYRNRWHITRHLLRTWVFITYFWLAEEPTSDIWHTFKSLCDEEENKCLGHATLGGGLAFRSIIKIATCRPRRDVGEHHHRQPIRKHHHRRMMAPWNAIYATVKRQTKCKDVPRGLGMGMGLGSIHPQPSQQTHPCSYASPPPRWI